MSAVSHVAKLSIEQSIIASEAYSQAIIYLFKKSEYRRVVAEVTYVCYHILMMQVSCET